MKILKKKEKVMSNIKLTKEQQKDLLELYNKALDDLWEIWQTSALKSVYIPMYFEDDKTKKWSFRIDDEDIRITCNTGYAHSISYTLARARTCFKKIVLIKDEELNQDIMFNFIKNYEDLRDKLIKRLSSSEAIKKDTDALFTRLKEQFNKTSTIEIDLKDINNRQTIEITEEDGKKIGTINFGHQTIRIITKGEITLVDQKEAVKTKKK